MKIVIKKIAAAALAFTLVVTGSAISGNGSEKSNELVVSARYGDSVHSFKTWRWSEVHGNYIYCYDCLFCTSCDYQTQPHLVAVYHK